MADPRSDNIDFDALERELNAAVEADTRYWLENDAKFRAIEQKAATYEEFKDIVAAAHLRPLEKKDHIDDKFAQPWNVLASKRGQGQNEKKTKEEKPGKTGEIELPTNGIEFSRDWRRTCETQREKYDFLMRLARRENQLARIFKPEISHGLLGDFLCCMQTECDCSTDICDVVSTLEQLSTAGRFDLSLTFLTSKEMEAAKLLFQNLEGFVCGANEHFTEEKRVALKDKLKELKNKYKIDTP